MRLRLWFWAPVWLSYVAILGLAVVDSWLIWTLAGPWWSLVVAQVFVGVAVRGLGQLALAEATWRFTWLRGLRGT